MPYLISEHAGWAFASRGRGAIYIYVWGFLVCLAVGDLYQDRYVNAGPWVPWAHGAMGRLLRSVYITVLG